ncbi:major capsid protein [Aliarcobacter butzleri]|uniref:major capsid protein n=1 Tax=Aliarcobacter butzleri TaxID=28197 RepID=UPI001EDB96B5|nr:major capsid protein [Aliarcobacter butzleri]MCG3658608.1 major capsid protein [Aliarcobacter butzleri]MDN5091012.1 major capsid protein [Aliarcobacter butzleri]
MTYLQVLKLWTLEVTMTAINQVKTSGSYVFDKYFKANAEPVLANTAKLKIYKGAGIVLKTILPGDDRLVQDLKNVYEITIELPRFGLSATILPSELVQFQTLEGVALAEALSKRITQILKEHKDDYMTTIEFMATGALFGKVVDGKGKVLFEFKSAANPIEFKNIELDVSLNKIDTALVDELGMEVPYEILCSDDFFTRIVSRAKAENLFENNGPAKYIDEAGKRVLTIHGKKFIPFRASYLDENENKKPFIEAGKAVVIPMSEQVYKVVYGRAEHTQAMKAAPQMFFAANPEELERGKGIALETETKLIPYCTRPGALINLVFSN